MKKDELALISKKQNEIVLTELGNNTAVLFEKAYSRSTAIVALRELLTNEYMTPIMALQGTKLGFRTDKDLAKDGSKGQGYPIEVVRDCLIEAVFLGLQPTGNEFNIIGGNVYPTKEGCKKMLDSTEGLSYKITTDITKINSDKTSAVITSIIEWNYNGRSRKETASFPLKMNAYTSVDSLIGKGKRKSYAWLLSEISGREMPEGDVDDTGFTPHAEIKPEAPPDLQGLQDQANEDLI